MTASHSNRLPGATSMAFASPLPAAPRVSASRSSASSATAAHASRSSHGTAARVEAVAGRIPGHGIVGDVARKEDIHPIALQILGNLGGLDVLVNNASSLGPDAARAARRHRVRGFRAGAGDQRARPVPADQGAPGRAGGVRARRPRQRRRSTSRATPRSMPIRWGAYGASKAALHHMSRIWDEELAAKAYGFCRSIPATWTRRCTRRRPGADPSALKRPPTWRERSPMRWLRRCRASARRLSILTWRRRTCDCRQPTRPAAVGRQAARGRRGGRSPPRRDRSSSTARPGDLVVANDAATMPASLHGVHLPSGAASKFGCRRSRSRAPFRLEKADSVRFAPWYSAPATSDHHRRPPVAAGSQPWRSAALRPSCRDRGACPRPSALRLDSLRRELEAVWAGLARHGRPIQYAHVPEALAMWDVWTPIAALPVAFEPPSASFVLDWRSVRRMRERGIRFATITLAAGISSTGDPELDRRLPLDEPYRISDDHGVGD